MNRKISIFSLILCVVFTAVLVFMTTFTVLTNDFKDRLAKAYEEETLLGNESDMPDTELSDGEKSVYEQKLSQLVQMFEDYAYYDLDTDAVISGMLDGFAYGTGDKYAEYYTAEDFSLFTAESNGEMQGIGVNIIFNSEYNAVEIINVMPNSPALEAGLLPGDLIVSVGIGENAESVAAIGYTMAVSKLQGLAGTTCEFVAVRDENFDKPMEFSIERKKVIVQSVTYHIYDGDSTVGIIRISEFDKATPAQFFAAIEDLTSKGVEKFVFDVRNNPGGDLGAICEILDFLLPEGPIIRMRDKSGNESVIYSIAEEEGEAFNSPVAVLCNGNSASAAELFTSALMDYKKATTVGTVTFGKGSVQTIYSLPDGGGVKMTTKMYFPPFSDGYDGIGITPNIVVEMADEFKNVSLYKISDADDTQLQRAIDFLNENN